LVLKYLTTYYFFLDKENDAPNCLEQLLQIDMFPTLDCMYNFGKGFSFVLLKQNLVNSMPLVEQHRIEASPIVVPANTMIVDNEQQENKIRFETELIPGFRGRSESDYIPKKPYKRNGEKSELRKPSYFADLRNRHFLNLLVCYFIKKIF
jgi:hypothetical protein